MTESFVMRNPNSLHIYGVSTVPINNYKGPELNTAYVLWERDIGVGAAGSIKNPTVDNHAGWNIISKGIFKGFEDIPPEREGEYGQKIPNQDWYPIMDDEIVYDPIFNVYPNIHREAIKFGRVWRTVNDRFNEPIGERPTDKIMSKLYWQKILHPSKHPELFRKRGEGKKENIKLFLTKDTNLNELDRQGDDMLGKFSEYLGGKKNIRKTKKKATKTTKNAKTMKQTKATKDAKTMKQTKANKTKKAKKVTKAKNTGKKTRRHKKQFLYNPNNPKKSFDVYIDKNPKDTIHIKYTTVKDIENTIRKLERLYKTKKYSHKRIWQVGMIMKVRLEAILKHKKTKYLNAKNIYQRYSLANRYFKFLGNRSDKKSFKERKALIFKL